jgi:hypothetical protein
LRIYSAKVMRQQKDLSKNALCSGVKPPVVRQSLLCRVAPDIGFLHSFSHPDFMTVIQNRGIQQSNLFPVSAGNDLRMSTMRPNPYLSTGIEMRKSKFRGFFQLFSRPN